MPTENLGRRIAKYIRRTLAAAVLIAALIWTADYLFLRHKVAQDGDAFGEIEVHYRFAVHLKSRRIEQSTAKPAIEECVHSMFSHYDERPCWYLEKHKDDLQELNGSPWHFFYDDE